MLRLSKRSSVEKIHAGLSITCRNMSVAIPVINIANSNLGPRALSLDLIGREVFRRLHEILRS